jgi:pimeloyl-ACP methyl ester carboxylesterase
MTLGFPSGKEGIRKSLVALALLLSLGGCYWRIAHDPMPFVAYGDLGPEQARGAIVLLPGFADVPQDFDRQGFVSILRERAPGYDVIAADAHFGYYNNHTLLDQLHANVIGPLVTRGYRELWILGISMGGHGAVAYARAYPERIKGLLLFAPYLGPGEVLQEVTRAGGICRYTAPVPLPEDRFGFAEANFAWLEDVLCSHVTTVSVWVGVGERDQMPRALLRAAVAPDHYFVEPGGHEWSAWKPALEKISRVAFADPSASLR